MRKRMVLVGCVVGVALVVAQTVSVGAKRATPSQDDEIYKQLELFEEALSLVRSDYVEEPKPQPLIYGALKGMLGTLDPYSQFMDPDSYNELKVETEGEFGGLGIEITVKDDLLTVISPIDDTPAFQAGMLANDRIVKIDGEMTRGITLLDAVKKLRGKPGTKVTLTILREGENELRDVVLERAIIKIDSVREASILEDGIGYVRISDFRERTRKELQDGLERLKAQGMEGLVLDLRNNPGGLLDVAVSVSELFLDRQQLIVTTKGRLRNQNLEFRARQDGPMNKVPLVVLINEGSASASEIFAGAMQDHHRGVVMGMKSHGKASVQTIFPLKDGSALRLTTSKYFTPAGRSIHGEGIHPDVEVAIERPRQEASSESKDKDNNKEKDHKADEIFEKLEQEGKGEPHPTVKKPFDNQLARAVDLLKALRVYQRKEVAVP